MTLGERIMKSRETKGLSQRKLALLVGTQQGTVSRWKKDDFRPSLEQLESIAESCEVDFSWLATGKIPPPELPPDELQILDLYRALKLSKEDALRGLALAARTASSEAWEGLTGAGRVVSVRDTTEHHDRLDRERLDRERKAAREESLRRAAPKRREETHQGEGG